MPIHNLITAGVHPVRGVYNLAALGLATVGTAEEILRSVTIERDWLERSGDYFEVTAVLTTAANANNKIPRIRLGGLAGALIAGGATVALNAGTFVLQATVRRILQATGVAWGIQCSGAALSACARAALTNDFGTDLALSVTGTTATAAGDLTLQELVVNVGKRP